MDLIPLIIAGALVGAFLFTLLITLLSLLGWVTFKFERQQSVLFFVVIVELVVGFAGNAAGLLPLSPYAVDRGNDKVDPNIQKITDQTISLENNDMKFVKSNSKISSGGGQKIFVLQCPQGSIPVGIDPVTSFPAQIRVTKANTDHSWSISVTNLHGDHRPDGNATITLACNRRL